ncbi:MAG TPA: hypothetical protein PKD10_16105 [Paracoccaceae bacterium]|nr:hypothetical protein [Paracoccaceae bacterium]
MRDGQQLPSGPARGVKIAGDRRQVVIKMDSDQFAEVRALAVANGISLAEQLRLLIEWGLEASSA